jgi:hypothetical protein
MNDIRFPEPVTLKSLTASRNVATSFEALECLDQQWPEGARGRSWRPLCAPVATRWTAGAARATRARPSSRQPGAPDWRRRQDVLLAQQASVIDLPRPETSFSGWQ